jgi:exodeoxyribonuclease V beta subunit
MGDNYAVQEQLYSLALVRMLGITDAATYEARFGGALYIFVRGLGHSAEAVRSRRPSFDEIVHWQHDLAVTLEQGGPS